MKKTPENPAVLRTHVAGCGGPKHIPGGQGIRWFWSRCLKVGCDRRILKNAFYDIERSIAHHLLNTLFTYILYIYIYTHTYLYAPWYSCISIPKCSIWEQANGDGYRDIHSVSRCHDRRWEVKNHMCLTTSDVRSLNLCGWPRKNGMDHDFFGYQGRGWVSKLWRFEQEHRFFLCIYTYMYIYIYTRIYNYMIYDIYI